MNSTILFKESYVHEVHGPTKLHTFHQKWKSRLVLDITAFLACYWSQFTLLVTGNDVFLRQFFDLS